MLLLVALALRGSIIVAPVPPHPNKIRRGSSAYNIDYTGRIQDSDELRDRLQRIIIDDSEIVAIVEITLRHFII